MRELPVVVAAVRARTDAPGRRRRRRLRRHARGNCRGPSSRPPARAPDGGPAATGVWLRRMAPRTPMPSASMAGAIAISWRALELMLRMTPPIVRSSRYILQPSTMAAAVSACVATSSTRTTGQPVNAARSAVEPRAALAAGRRAVEQAHDAFDHAEVRVGRVRGDKRVDELRAHRPRIEVDALTSGSRRMEGRIDIVGSALERLDGDALVAQRAQQAQRQRRLAGAGACGGDDDAPRPPPAHAVAPARLASNSVRKAAMRPTTTMAGAPMPFALASSAAAAKLRLQHALARGRSPRR